MASTPVAPVVRIRPARGLRGGDRFTAAVCRGAGAALLLLLLVCAPAVSAGERSAGQRLRAWGDGQRLELLPLQQSSLEVLARSEVTLMIRPHDLLRPTPQLLLTPPPTLDARAIARHLRLCRIRIPGDSRPARCQQALPLQLILSDGSLRLRPESPLQPQQAYGLELVLRNPLQQGFHPLRLFALDPQRPAAEYLGTWLLQTDTQSE